MAEGMHPANALLVNKSVTLAQQTRSRRVLSLRCRYQMDRVEDQSTPQTHDRPWKMLELGQGQSVFQRR